MRRIPNSNSDGARITPPPPNAGEDEVSDRVSKLPESVIHHIFDLMRCSKAVARTQILSKHWKRLFDSYPAFDYDQSWFCSPWNASLCNSVRREELDIFNDYVERSVATRLDRIEFAARFRMYAEGNSDKELRAGWIRAAIAKGVKELDVTFLCVKSGLKISQLMNRYPVH